MIEWKKVPLKNIAKIERNIVEAIAIKDGTRYVGLRNIATGGDFINVREVRNGELSSSKFSFTPKHLLYGKLRPYLAKIARPDFEGICSTDILPVLAGSKLSRDYLFYYLLQPSVVANASLRATGVNLPRLSPKSLAELEIYLPPLEDQKRIAAILDKADAIRRKRRQAIQLADEFLRSVFLDMFGDPVLNPKGWKEARLDQICEIVSGVTKGRKLSSKPTVIVPYMRVANVQDGRILIDDVQKIEVLESEIEKFRLKRGDILLTEGGDPDKLGRGAVWKGEIDPCIHQNHIFRVRTNDQIILPGYLSALIGSQRGKRYFLKAAKQTTGVASINKTQLSGFPALIPPIDTQYEYLNRLENFDLMVDTQMRNYKESDNLFNSLTQRAFRGEL